MRDSVLAPFVLVLFLALAPAAVAVPPGTFGRMFPELAPFTEPTDPQILALARTMLAQGGDNPDHPVTPAGFTFFGQFLDHDQTLDTEPQPTAPVNTRTLDNDRTGIFDLDSVYGDGPQGTPQLYESDRKRLKVGVSGSLNEIPDVPREENGTAILADGRNDENLIIAQLHAAFLRFHNRLIEEGKSFADAQRLTRWHYQWLIVHDYLPLIVGDENVARFLHSNGEFYKPDNPHDPVLPVEFAVAAFRFGHSQVRPFYLLNADTALPIFSLDSPDLRGGRSVPENAGIEWQRFFEVDGLPEEPNLKKRIDTKISQGLFELPIPGAAASGSNVLAFRNMVRGKHYGLPSGQAVAEAMGAELIFTPAELDLGSGFDNGTPLWFYILAESERRELGLRLGEVGARIVAEVFLTNLKRDGGSYLKAKPAFQPSVPHQGDFTIGDFLQFAGVVQN